MIKVKIKIVNCPILNEKEFFEEVKRGLLDNTHELNIKSEDSLIRYEKLRNDFFVIDSFEDYQVWLDKEGFEVYKSCSFGTSSGGRMYKGKLTLGEKVFLLSLCNYNQEGFEGNNIGEAAQESLDIFLKG